MQIQPQIVIARAGEQHKAGLRVGPRTVKDKVRDAIKKSSKAGQESDTSVSNQPPTHQAIALISAPLQYGG